MEIGLEVVIRAVEMEDDKVADMVAEMVRGGHVGLTGQVDDELDKVAKEVANTHSSNFG